MFITYSSPGIEQKLCNGKLRIQIGLPSDTEQKGGRGVEAWEARHWGKFRPYPCHTVQCYCCSEEISVELKMKRLD